MIKITINGKKYKGAYSWEDISLSRYCDLAAIPMPEGYKEFIIADGKFSPESQESIDKYIEATSTITDEQLKETFPAYYRKVISCLTDIPDSVVIPSDKVNDLYEYFFKPFVASLVYHAPLVHIFGKIEDYRPSMMRSFKIGLQRFYLPETINVMGQDIPMGNEPIVTYTEASDIFRGMKLTKDDIHKMALFMAIYCRKKGEAYDEKKVLDRKDLFMKAPMSVVWSVFFCIIKRLPDYMTITLLFGRLPKTIQQSVSEVRTFQSMVVEV